MQLCIASIHVQSKMNVPGTFGGHGMGGGDTTASLTCELFLTSKYITLSVLWQLLQICAVEFPS